MPNTYTFRRIFCLATPLFLVAVHLYAGQSVTLTPQQLIPIADPQYPANQSWRIEFQIHDWAPPASGVGRLISLDGLGFASFIRPDGLLDLESDGDRVVEQAPCFVNITGMKNALVRFQRNVATKAITCEAWNFDGSGYNFRTETISTLGNLGHGGGSLGGGATASLGFVRVFTTVLALGSRPPTTADVADWTDLRFDNNLSDSTKNAHGGTALPTTVFQTTPNQVPIAFAKTYAAPFWTSWTSLRAGFPARLDGSSSYSLADGNAAVTYAWKQVDGPSTVIWQNQNTATPTITGLIFGDYTFSLQVTDAASHSANTTLEVGAVATDSNGVVINANPATDAIFGPMIAFGKNPWGWADERNLKMENLQKNTFATPPSWSAVAENATVDYRFFNPNGIPAFTTTAADVSATALTIDVTNSVGLDLSSLPTQIIVGNGTTNEIIRICSASGNALTVCYDGRGYHYGLDNSYIRAATIWPAGTKIWQAKAKGNGTHFFTTMCEFGLGWAVASTHAVTAAGTVAVTPGSVVASGNGTPWDGKQNSLAIAVFATHGGVPFTFFSYVVSASGSSLTLARQFPADADAGSYSYRIFSDQRRIVLHYTRSDSTDGTIYFPTSGCESDTTVYFYQGWDNGYNNQRNPASPYSYIDGAGYAGDYSPNYYDMGLAHYAFYFRSGLKQSLTAARNIEDYWLNYPEIAQGDAGGSPRDRSVLGVFAAAVLDGDRASNWSGLRTFAQQGLHTAQVNNCNDDLRETAYQMSWLALAAQFDPDLTQRANWRSGLAGSAYSRDNGCKTQDNSFASSFYWNASGLQLASTQGSTTVKAVNGEFPANMCFGTAHGTALATNGSALLTALTGSFIPPAGSYKLLVGGTIGGVRHDVLAQFDYNSAGSLTMSVMWPGDSGTVYWSIENNDYQGYVLSIAEGPADTANFGQISSCTLTDSTHIELYRPWATASGTFAYSYYNLIGRGTQPFMAGIKTLQMRYAGQVFAPYQSLANGAANWIGTTGFDPKIKAIYYGRGFPQCEPAVSDSGITDVAARLVGCMENGSNLGAVSQARARNAEAQNAMTMMYSASPTASNRALGDAFYGATYGAPGYTAAGYFSDGTTASNLDDVSLGSYKWPGFFFGVGMAHQWPAVRVGGVAAPVYRTVNIAVTLGSSASSVIRLTAPSGAITTYQCGTKASCSVTVDDRQGTHWYQIQYLSADEKVLSQSAPVLVPVPAHS